MKEKLFYLKKSLVHPFDAFYEIRFRDKGSMLLAVLSVLIFCALRCVRYQYTGFVMNLNNIYEMNSLRLFISALSIIVLFVFSNWSVTTLLGGKGNTKYIFMVAGYALVPISITDIITVILSNYVISEEVMIVNVITGIGIVWFVFVGIAGLCEIHEYGLFKTLASLLLTIVAAVIIIFILILVFSLEEKMVSFVSSVISEAVRRLR